MAKPKRNYIFLYEGSAEKFIINSLHDAQRLKINGNLILDNFADKESNANFTFKSFMEMRLSASDRRGCTVVLVGDKLGSKVNTNFFENDKEEKEFEEMSASLLKVSIKPEPEILFVHHFNIYDEWCKIKNNNKIDLCAFLKEYIKNHKKIKIKGKINVKSIILWDQIFADIDDLISAIKKLNKSNDELNEKNNIKVIGYKDII